MQYCRGFCKIYMIFVTKIQRKSIENREVKNILGQKNAVLNWLKCPKWVGVEGGTVSI